MIKFTSPDSNIISYVALSKIISITEENGDVFISVLDVAKAVKVSESLDEILSRINKVLESGKAF